MTKTIYLKILLTGIFLLTLSSVSYSAEWQLYGQNKEGTHFYDKKNIKQMPKNIISVWDKIIYTDDGKEGLIKSLGNLYKDVDISVALFKINCHEKIYLLVQSTYYDSKGSPIRSNDFSTIAKENFIRPDSMMETLYKIVCK